MSFACPHFLPDVDRCMRVNDVCVCGRPGCVLANNSVFAIAPAIRLDDARRAAQQTPASLCRSESPKR